MTRTSVSLAMIAVIRRTPARHHTDDMNPKARGVPMKPAHPERTCWGCGQYCPADDLGCRNGTIRTLHPVELFGDDWLDFTDCDPVPPCPVPSP